jgi:hypothetical protein
MKKKQDEIHIRKCICQRVEGKIQVSVTIANDSDRPCFIIPRLRRILLNSESGVLTLYFSGRGEPKAIVPKMRVEFTAPQTLAIPERSEKIITTSLSEDMTRLVVHEDGSFHLEALDLTQAHTVEVQIAWDDKPFYPSPERKDMERHVARWGNLLAVQAPVENRHSSNFLNIE